MLIAVRRHWIVVVLSTLAAFAGCIAALSLAPSAYTGTSVLTMVPRAETDSSLLVLSIPNYSALATSPVVATEVADLHDVAADRLQNAISVSNPPASNTLLVSVQWDEPGTAARLANSVADELVESAETDSILSADVVAEATSPTSPSWPPWRPALVLGGVLSLAVGIAAARLADRRQVRPASPADVAESVERQDRPAPVLLAVPNDPEALVGFLAGVVERFLAGRARADTAHIAFLVAGRRAPQRVSVVADVAAALRRSDRRVFVSLVEREDGAVRWLDLRGGSPVGDPGRSGDEMSANELILRDGENGPDHRERGADAVLLISDRLEQAIQASPSGSLEAAITVVLPRAPRRELRKSLRALDRTGIPHLAVVQWLRPSATGSDAVTGAPSRAGNVRDDALQAPDRPLISAPSTSRSS